MFLVVDIMKDRKKMLEEKFSENFGLVELEILANHLGREVCKSPVEIVEWKI